MPLKLMYITNNPEVACIAEANGVDRIFVDLEYIGKSLRQGGLDTVQNHHTVEDVKAIREVVKYSELLTRVNPIHKATSEYCSSKDEIDAVIEAGADIVMLPYFKTCDEVSKFLTYVDGRAKTMLLFETVEAVNCIDEILKLDGIDEVFIGLNDLSLGFNKKFMFEVLADGTVEEVSTKFKKYNKVFGFGGIASLGKGMLPAEYIIREHYKLGSSSVILSRSFCDVAKAGSMYEVKMTFEEGVKAIREFEARCSQEVIDDSNLVEIRSRVEQIVNR